MEIESSFDSGASSSNATETVIDLDRYQKFMSINTIWSFFNIPKSEYMMQTKELRVPLIEKYYKHTVNVKNICLLVFS